MKVAEYRNIISHLERVVNCDFHSCVGDEEKARWVEIAKRVGTELINAQCPRAKADDRERAERIIDRSATRILSITGYKS